MQPTLEPGELLRAGLAVVRARQGFYIRLYLVCMLPMILLSAASTALQAEALRDVFVALMRGAPIPFVPNNPAATGLQLASYATMLLGVPVYALLATRAALDQLDGVERSLRALLTDSLRPILWMMTLDSVLLFLNYLGCICCLFPGLAIAVAVVAYLSLQTPILCDRPVDWVVAARESRTLSRPHVGPLMSASALYGLVWVGVTLVLAIVAVLGFVAIVGTDTLEADAILRGAVVAYGGMFLVSLLPSTYLTALWFTFRAVAYHRLQRQTTPQRMEAVFA